MSESKRKAADYRRQAAMCLEVAKQVSLHDDRSRVLEMAKRFLDLAQEEEGKTDDAPPTDVLVFLQTTAAVSASSVALTHLEDDLHDIIDRVRASERMVEESRTILKNWERLFPRPVPHYHRPRLCPPGVGG
jgi:hypothetical protein